MIFGPRHTFDSVVQSLVSGLRDGSLTLQAPTEEGAQDVRLTFERGRVRVSSGNDQASPAESTEVALGGEPTPEGRVVWADDHLVVSVVSSGERLEVRIVRRNGTENAP